tara:strand:- start:328 stop:603 length:276 start_codon:yes stop_codon:yes gene_type:complete
MIGRYKTTNNFLKASPSIELTKKYGIGNKYAYPYNSRKLSKLYKKFLKKHLKRKQKTQKKPISIKGKKRYWKLKEIKIIKGKNRTWTVLNT